MSKRKFVTIDGYPIDATVSESHSLKTTVTRNPVENGSSTADHAVDDPYSITLEGVVSDTPLSALADHETRKNLTGEQLPSKDAYQRFLAIRAAKKTVTIECSLGKLENMFLTELTIPRAKDNTKSLYFTAVFEELIVTENQRTTVPVSVQNGGGKANLGTKEALLKYLNQNLIWVVSYVREGDGLGDFGSGRVVSSSIHKPVHHPIYGTPVMSTSHLDRIGTNNFDKYGEFWVDHYKIAVGDKETNKSMLLTDGYVVLADTGANPTNGVKKNVKRGYYFLRSGGYPGMDRTTSPNDLQSQRLVDDDRKSITQRPPGPSKWPGVLKDNQ